MPTALDKVIGYFAYSAPEAVVCTGSACIVAGSEAVLRAYLAELAPGATARYTVRKTRLGEIMRGLRLGAAYAFDEESYRRFLPLGRAEGVELADADFSRHTQRFFTVRLTRE